MFILDDATTTMVITTSIITKPTTTIKTTTTAPTTPLLPALQHHQQPQPPPPAVSRSLPLRLITIITTSNNNFIQKSMQPITIVWSSYTYNDMWNVIIPMSPTLESNYVLLTTATCNPLLPTCWILFQHQKLVAVGTRACDRVGRFVGCQQKY